MELLTYETLEKTGYEGYLLKDAPEKVLQFGEGNFLRAFADYWFDLANERAGWNGKCALVQPIAAGLAEQINAQEGLYTLYLRGREDGRQVDRRRVISSVSRCLNPYTPEGYQAMMEVAASPDLEYIVSNTTEAGIVYDPACQAGDCPPSSFPAKLAQVLFHRFQAGRGPLAVLSCELIDNNGKELEKCVRAYAAQWGLGGGFTDWLEGCAFCSTLVDRIVPGRIRDSGEIARLEQANGYRDELLDVGEVFGVWDIEGPEWLEDRLPFKAAGLNCPVVPDAAPYKKRKVRILNGAHTGFALGAYLAGFDIVRDCMADDAVRGFMNKMLFDEVLPTLDVDGAEEFAAAVQDRFSNPFIDHKLLDISLNSTAKWRARDLPSVIGYVDKFGKLPPCLAASFAFYIAFYRGAELRADGLAACREGDGYLVRDDRAVLEFFYAHREESMAGCARAVMKNDSFWGRDLTEIPGFEDAVAQVLEMLQKSGAHEAMARLAGM